MPPPPPPPYTHPPTPKTLQVRSVLLQLLDGGSKEDQPRVLQGPQVQVLCTSSPVVASTAAAAPSQATTSAAPAGLAIAPSSDADCIPTVSCYPLATISILYPYTSIHIHTYPSATHMRDANSTPAASLLSTPIRQVAFHYTPLCTGGCIYLGLARTI